MHKAFPFISPSMGKVLITKEIQLNQNEAFTFGSFSFAFIIDSRCRLCWGIIYCYQGFSPFLLHTKDEDSIIVKRELRPRICVNLCRFSITTVRLPSQADFYNNCWSSFRLVICRTMLHLNSSLSLQHLCKHTSAAATYKPIFSLVHLFTVISV